MFALASFTVGFIHVVACVTVLFLLYGWVIFHGKNIPLFCWQAFELFPFWGIMNKSFINMLVCVVPWTDVLVFLICMPKSSIAESIVRSIFNEIKNFQTFSKRGGIILHSHQEFEHSAGYTPLPILRVASVFNFIYFSGYIVAFCYGFNLHFSHD